MYLKSLTLRGFKSFASSTTLRLEPGITCVVGPNGSGKSNVVDALAWVMGEQGAKSLRGGKMEDVIFAGTSGRPPLGRAEVLLTIDNSDGALPIEYTEVTLSRTMFRDGGSEYAINGQTCRLLDVQELLSDSGIGREMHVIVGQGQLDTILHATPEDRRGFIEEAAGVLKHRKRKEKALRKLDATEGNLTRLADLLNEIRRQLKPLGRQAEVARRASVVQMDARDARARLLADDVVHGQGSQEQELADEEALRERRTGVETALATSRTAETELEAGTAHGRAAAGAGPGDLVRSDRRRGSDCGARRGWRPSGSATGPTSQRRSEPAATPTRWRPRPSGSAAQETEIQTEIAGHQQALEQAVRARGRGRGGAHATRTAGSPACSGPLPTAARAWPGCPGRSARCAAGLRPPRTRSAGSAARAPRRSRAERAQHDFTALETRIAGLDAGERGLDAEHEGAAALLERHRRTGWPSCARRSRTAERERAALDARNEALELGLSPQGRRGRAAGRQRRRVRAARVRRRAAVGAVRLRDRRGRRARLGRRRGGRLRRRRGRGRDRAPQGRRPRPGRAGARWRCRRARRHALAGPARRGRLRRRRRRRTGRPATGPVPAALQDRRRRRPRRGTSPWSPTCRTSSR